MNAKDQTAMTTANPFGPAESPTAAMVAQGSAREQSEVQSMLVIAKRFPRNQIEAMDRILQA